MLEVLSSWLYMLITSFSVGWIFLLVFNKIYNHIIEDINTVVIFGIMFLTIYSQIFSLFYKVGLVANIIVILITVMVVILQHKQMLVYLNKRLNNKKILPLCFIILIIAFFTSRGVISYDTEAYYAQSIHWIEDYGVVKGLGNISRRLAFNSSFLSLQALFSMKFMINRSLHTVNGFLAVILCSEIVSTHKNIYSLLMSLAALTGVVISLHTIVSPATDHPAMFLTFFIFVKWLRNIQNEVVDNNAMLDLLSCFVVSIKVSQVPLLLLCIVSLIRFIKYKNYISILKYLTMYTLILAPWLVRNVLISGYLLFPFTAIDVFNVDWKMPKTIVDYEQQFLHNYSLGVYTDGWLQSLSASDKIIIVACLLSIFIFVLSMFMYDKLSTDILIIFGVIVYMCIFWFITAPQTRYGYAYLLGLMSMSIGSLYKIYSSNCKYLAIVFILLMLIQFSEDVQHLVPLIKMPYYVKQMDYTFLNLRSYIVNGTLFYYSEASERVGYYAFPATPQKIKIRFRGDSIADGFLPAVVLSDKYKTAEWFLKYEIYPKY